MSLGLFLSTISLSTLFSEWWRMLEVWNRREFYHIIYSDINLNVSIHRWFSLGDSRHLPCGNVGPWLYHTRDPCQGELGFHYVGCVEPHHRTHIWMIKSFKINSIHSSGISSSFTSISIASISFAISIASISFGFLINFCIWIIEKFSPMNVGSNFQAR